MNEPGGKSSRPKNWKQFLPLGKPPVKTFHLQQPFIPVPARNLLICLLALFASAATLRALDWIEPSAEELAATASAIDPEAGAEILYRVRQIDCSDYSGATDDYTRIKVFGEKGVRQLEKVDVEYNAGDKISSLQARVIKPDGTVINVEKNAFYDREIVKYGDIKMRVRSFSFPRLEPGDIAEYKSRILSDDVIYWSQFYFLGEMPARHAVFRVKPARLHPPYGTMAFYYKCDEQKIQRDKAGFSYVEMKNQPAFVRETDMEPEDDVQPWMMFYPAKTGQSPDAFWRETAMEAGAKAERHAKKPGKLVRETATTIAASATTDEARLARLTDYCRANIVNYYHYIPNGGLDEKIRKQKDRTPDDLIKTKRGHCEDIPVLFVAMARSLGIDARIALCANRRKGAFKKNLPMAYFLDDIIVAVKIGGEWRYYDPAHNLVNTGSLRWLNEGVPVLIVMPKGVEWAVTPATPGAQSMMKRTARLRLNDEGTLLGDVTIEYSGQCEIDARYDFYTASRQKIEELVRERVQARMPNAEVSDIAVTNAHDVLKPVSLSYSVKIPGYAENAGQRFFIQPGFFTKGAPARFTAAERQHNMNFSYPMTERDDIEITLPAHFRIEEGSSPPDIKPGDWGGYELTIAMKKSTNSILYKRDFVFNPRWLPPKAYKTVKYIFDTVHANDSHALTLRMGR